MTVASRIKRNGVHYTPPELAGFLADEIAVRVEDCESLLVLDPACGDGELLAAIVQALPPKCRQNVRLVGYETDESAARRAENRLTLLDVATVEVTNADFLSLDSVRPRHRQTGLFDKPVLSPESTKYDIVIANPPYVRTQVLGAKRAQELAERFGLTGRVDLYQAFTKAMVTMLKPGGVMGLLTSNRFLTIRSGSSLRRLLRSDVELQAIFDLGDTKLFSAAVLPAIVIARKPASNETQESQCQFLRIYETTNETKHSDIRRYSSVLRAVRDEHATGTIHVPSGCFHIERGFLASSGKDEAWSLATVSNQSWQSMVEDHTICTFEDIAEIRVGIKSTADKVFIRKDWSHIAIEPELLHPLITHRDAQRWVALPTVGQFQILYPHKQRGDRKAAVDLDRFPLAHGYLRQHEERLRQRTYVLDAGRQWYEIWVPHWPHNWQKPKIVFPDIAVEPRFFLDTSGALVSGECYWITLRDGVSDEWLPLMLAVANSSFVTKFYDVVFHNKLYSGRRRFQTQFVRKFPLPQLDAPIVQDIIGHAQRLIRDGANADLEKEIDDLVWQAFGLVKEV
jgi:adenine-specific DNA-methyltransferase